MDGENNTLMHSLLVEVDGRPKKSRVSFKTARQNMGWTSVYDIIRPSKPEFARQLATLSDASTDLAYDNAMAYAALIGRLYLEYKTSSNMFQLNFQDERYLPFEYTGAVSRWTLTFPNLDAQKAMLESLNDIIIHILYTARPSGGSL